MFLFVADQARNAQDRIVGTVRMPAGARIVHAGARPPDGKLAIWAECTSLEIPDSSLVAVRLLILKHDDEIPPDHVYRGYILSAPILFIYEDVKGRDRRGIPRDRQEGDGHPGGAA